MNYADLEVNREMGKVARNINCSAIQMILITFSLGKQSSGAHKGS